MSDLSSLLGCPEGSGAALLDCAVSIPHFSFCSKETQLEVATHPDHWGTGHWPCEHRGWVGFREEVSGFSYRWFRESPTYSQFLILPPIPVKDVHDSSEVWGLGSWRMVARTIHGFWPARQAGQIREWLICFWGSRLCTSTSPGFRCTAQN